MNETNPIDIPSGQLDKIPEEEVKRQDDQRTPLTPESIISSEPQPSRNMPNRSTDLHARLTVKESLLLNQMQHASAELVSENLGMANARELRPISFSQVSTTSMGDIVELTQQDYDFIQESWYKAAFDMQTTSELINNSTPRIASYVYSLLFAECANIRADVFDRYHHRHWNKKMFVMISSVVLNLDFLEGIKEVLTETGIQHVEYGVTQEQFVMFCNCLLQAIRLCCSDLWTSQHEQSWIKGLTIICTIMSKAAEPNDGARSDGAVRRKEEPVQIQSVSVDKNLQPYETPFMTAAARKAYDLAAQLSRAADQRQSNSGQPMANDGFQRVKPRYTFACSTQSQPQSQSQPQPQPQPQSQART